MGKWVKKMSAVLRVASATLSGKLIMNLRIQRLYDRTDTKLCLKSFLVILGWAVFAPSTKVYDRNELIPQKMRCPKGEDGRCCYLGEEIVESLVAKV